MTPDSRVVVLHSLADDSNPFVRQLMSASAGVESHAFSWRRALCGRWDILHLHWPERFSRGRSRRERLQRIALTSLLLVRLHATRTPVVRTLHNEAPHDGADAVDRFLDRRWDALTVHYFSMTRLCDRAPFTFVPHGSYHGAYVFDLEAVPDPDRLLCFGRIRPYKGVPELLELVRGRAIPFQLRIAGRPTTSDLARQLEELADPQVTTRLAFLSPDEITEELARAGAVVFPYTRMQNSGAVLLALTAHRPVIVPQSSAMRELADELGTHWVQCVPQPMTLDGLVVAWHALVETAPQRAATGPDLSLRAWDMLGARVERVYRDVVL